MLALLWTWFPQVLHTDFLLVIRLMSFSIHPVQCSRDSTSSKRIFISWTYNPDMQKSHPYSWWLKSCTTWDVSNPVNNWIHYLSTGARFLPSTVPQCLIGKVYQFLLDSYHFQSQNPAQNYEASSKDGVETLTKKPYKKHESSTSLTLWSRVNHRTNSNHLFTVWTCVKPPIV